MHVLNLRLQIIVTGGAGPQNRTLSSHIGIYYGYSPHDRRVVLVWNPTTIRVSSKYYVFDDDYTTVNAMNESWHISSITMATAEEVKLADFKAARSTRKRDGVGSAFRSFRFVTDHHK